MINYSRGRVSISTDYIGDSKIEGHWSNSWINFMNTIEAVWIYVGDSASVIDPLSVMIRKKTRYASKEAAAADHVIFI